MSQASTEIVRISGHAGTVPGVGLNREYQVCKLVDTTTCIGCKACEVACLEWNGYTFTQTTFDNSYQTMPETAWNYWNLIKACPTGCLHFGTKLEMKELAETRAAQLREHSGHRDAGVYDPPGVGGTHVIYVLHDAKHPELYGGLPSNPKVPVLVQLWKKPPAMDRESWNRLRRSWHIHPLLALWP